MWDFENNEWSKLTGGDAAETGSGPGSYDIRKSVWHVNCCNPEVDGGGGWGIFNSILGWTNSATYGSILSYNLYWLAVIAAFGVLGFHEKRGHYPFLKAKVRLEDVEVVESDDQASLDRLDADKNDVSVGVTSSPREGPA